MKIINLLLSLMVILAFILLNAFLYIEIRRLNIINIWFGASTAISFGLFWLSCKYIFTKLYNAPITKGFTECEVELNNYQLNGNGTTLIGKFGRYGNFYRSYQCFCFLWIIPLFPLDCVVKGPTIEVENDWFESTETYAILGRSAWYPLEVAVLIWRPLAIIGGVVSLCDLLTFY